MKIYLQTPSLEAIRRAADAGLLDGVVLTAADVGGDEVEGDVRDRVGAIAAEFAVPVCVPVEAVAGAEIYREGRELARLSDQVLVQVPFVEDALPAIRRLVADGVRVAATHIFSGAQAFLAAKVGAATVTVNALDLETHGHPSARIVREIREVLDIASLECDLSVEVVRTAVQFTGFVLARADSVWMHPADLDALLVHSLTDRAVDRYLSALSRRHKSRNT